jgi:hypothetical protein
VSSPHHRPESQLDVNVIGFNPKSCHKITPTKTKKISWGFGKPSKGEDRKISTHFWLGTRVFCYSQILCLFQRGDNAIEIHFTSGYSVLLNGVEGLADMIANSNEKQGNRMEIQITTGNIFFQSLGYINTWICGKMSNFEYLIRLNMVAGRSFHDISHYPIFPCVLADFVSPRLDLENKTVFRDMSQPGKEMNLNVPGLLCRIGPFTELCSSEQKLTSIPKSLPEMNILIPEFYFVPDFLLSTVESLGNVELPPWSKSSFDFIYLHRKALEKIDCLNVWIDQIFGYELKEGKQLFLSPHPKRRLIPQVSILQKEITLKLSSEQYIFGIAEQFETDEIKIQITAIDSAFNLDRLELTFTSGSNQFSQESVPKESLNLPDLMYSFFKVNGSKFAAVSKHGIELKLINHHNTIESIQMSSSGRPITAISGSHDSLLLSLSDGTNQLWRIHRDPRCMFSFPTYRSRIRCSFTSNPFDVTVIGTDDCWLMINSLSDGRTTHSVKLDCIPLKVLVTPFWGFILVQGCEYENEESFYSLVLLNINGLFIRKVKFPGLIADWFTWTSIDGFDFVILSVEKGRLFGFEVFFLEVESPIHRFTSEIVCLYFASSANIIAVLEANGTLHLIPFTTQVIQRDE